MVRRFRYYTHTAIREDYIRYGQLINWKITYCNIIPTGQGQCFCTLFLFGLVYFCFVLPQLGKQIFFKCSYFVSFNFFAQSRPAEILFFIFFISLFFIFLFCPNQVAEKKLSDLIHFVLIFVLLWFVLDNILLNLRTLECFCCVKMAREGDTKSKSRGHWLGAPMLEVQYLLRFSKMTSQPQQLPVREWPFVPAAVCRERERESACSPHLTERKWEKGRKIGERKKQRES